MMKAIIVNNYGDIFRRIFPEKKMAKLHELFDLEEKIYTSVDELRAADLRDVEVIVTAWGAVPMTEDEIRECLPALKAVFYAGGSVQNFARPFLNCGVRLFSGWHGNGTAVAQFSFAQIMLATKGYFSVQQTMKAENREAARLLGQKYPGAYDVKVGLLGCGAIGSQVAEMLKMTDCEVWAYDPFLPEERAEELGVKKTGMQEIFENCHVISNHLANLPATQGIIRRECFMSMIPYSTFINTGRGAQLNETDLYDALAADETRTALLDVVIDEGHADTNPLRSLPNCFATPHISGSSGNEVQRMGDRIIEAIEIWQAGGKSRAEVSMKMLETMA